MPSYRTSSLSDLEGATAAGVLLFEGKKVTVPAIAFGDTPSTLAARGLAGLAEQWSSCDYVAGEVRRWSIPSAVVHGPYGIITVGDTVLTDTLHHIPFHEPGYGREGDLVTLPSPSMTTENAAGLHASGGNYQNYYHFLLDILPKVQTAPFYSERVSGPMILSPAQTIPQRYVKSFLSRHGYDSIDLGVGETLSVVDLEFIPNMVGHGYAPHPALRQFFNNLLASAQLAEPGAVLDDRGERRIYISRRDSNNRILTNEQAVIDLVSSYGYCTFELSAMNFTEQMSLFHSATHIISPHGAGLANIVFCRPGTFVCELNMDTYLNGCIRRLAAISQVNYGCLIGLADENSRKLSWPHAMRWSLPIDPLIDTLKQLS